MVKCPFGSPKEVKTAPIHGQEDPTAEFNVHVANHDCAGSGRVEAALHRELGCFLHDCESTRVVVIP